MSNYVTGPVIERPSSLGLPSFGTIAKAILGLVLVGLLAYDAFNLDKVVTASEWALLVGVAVSNGVLVYFLPFFNGRVAKYAKAIGTLIVAVTTYLAAAWITGFTINDSIIREAIVQAIIASGVVAVVPNAGISAKLGPGYDLDHGDDLTDTQVSAPTFYADETASKVVEDDVDESRPYTPARYARMTEAEPDGPIRT